MKIRIRGGLIALLIVSWCLFQLALPSFLILDSIAIRAVHLAFGMSLVFLTRPCGWTLKQCSGPVRYPLVAFIIATVSILVLVYILHNRTDLAARAGRSVWQDHVVAVLLILLVLEATRRVIGWPLVIVALLFSVYAFCGPYMPGIFAFKGVSLPKYLHQIALSTEGIFGIPLDVAANMVFLFVLLGAMMEKAGAGHFFNDLSLALLGRYSGGPAKAAVVSSGFTGMVSGSSIANVVTTGTFTIPLMTKIGYPARLAAATEVAASTNGQLMPPIMGAAAFVMAEYLAVPYVEVIRAAALPAIVSYMALFYITHLEAKKHHIHGIPREQLPRIGTVLKQKGYHLAPLMVLMFELMIRRRSPQLSAFYAICVLVVIIVVRALKRMACGQISCRETASQIVDTMGQGLVSGAHNILPVTMATATAGIVVGIVNMGLGSLIVEIVEVLSGGNIFLLLFITAMASLIIGMGLPTTATYIVMASVTVPVITQIGETAGFAIPLIAAHLFCFYFGILADDTPPVGLAAYAASAIAGSDPVKTGITGFVYDLRTAIIPFMFVLNPSLILYNIHSPVQIILICITMILGCFAFVNALQGWLFVKNRWYESILLAGSGLLFMYPAALQNVCRSDALSWSIAAGLYLTVMLLQKSAHRLSEPVKHC